MVMRRRRFTFTRWERWTPLWTWWGACIALELLGVQWSVPGRWWRGGLDPLCSRLASVAGSGDAGDSGCPRGADQPVR